MSPQERFEYRTFLVVLAGWVLFTAIIAAGVYQLNDDVGWLLAAIWIWVCLSVFGYVLHTRLPLPGEHRPALEPASDAPLPGE